VIAGRRKNKNSKETQDHGKSKDSEKGKEARISETAQQATRQLYQVTGFNLLRQVHTGHELAVALPRAAVPGTAALLFL
jgi:hypothetical protein